MAPGWFHLLNVRILISLRSSCQDPGTMLHVDLRASMKHVMVSPLYLIPSPHLKLFK